MKSAGFVLRPHGLEPASPLALGGLAHGYGVFETIRAYRGRLFEPAAHLARMRSGAAGLRLADPPADSILTKACLRALANTALEDARVRVLWVASVGGAELWTRLDPIPGEIIIQTEAIDPRLDPIRQAGVAAMISSHHVNEASPITGVKTIGYAPHILAKHEAVRANAYEGIILNCRGEIVEGSMSNIFVVREGVLLTPALECGPLAGVTRGIVIDLARAAGIACDEIHLRPEALTAADEVFLTSSLSEVMPVIRVDGTDIAGGKPGPITRQLQESYGRLTAAL